MSATLFDAPTSPLDRPPTRFAHRPFYVHTLTLLRSVRDRDYATLEHFCDDDFGIVDVAPDGSSRVAHNRLEWERWYHELFAILERLDASTDSEILDYHSVKEGTLGYSVVEFRQSLTIADVTATFDCIATVVWKKTPQGWREARWHGSVVSSDVPAEMLLLTGGVE